ncbi:MAG TPA: ABC transporter substrate-binding protein, partial [Alphaproteobacteria bacterium]|nr:ABC transporter substrate-binding protein [Alphaproteobacteria bacterium]
IKIGREISTEGGGSVSVQTEIKKPSSSTKVTWVLLNGKITNLVVDGISLVVTFRDQLNDLDRQYPDPKQLALHINNAGK